MDAPPPRRHDVERADETLGVEARVQQRLAHRVVDRPAPVGAVQKDQRHADAARPHAAEQLVVVREEGLVEEVRAARVLEGRDALARAGDHDVALVDVDGRVAHAKRDGVVEHRLAHLQALDRRRRGIGVVVGRDRAEARHVARSPEHLAASLRAPAIIDAVAPVVEPGDGDHVAFCPALHGHGGRGLHRRRLARHAHRSAWRVGQVDLDAVGGGVDALDAREPPHDVALVVMLGQFA